jgi:hypothetical protein
VARPTQIDELLARYPAAVQATAAAARELLTSLLPGIEEAADFPAKLISYSYGPGYKGTLFTLILSQKGVKLGVVRGVELPDPKKLMTGEGLPDPKKLMTGEGKVHRHVQLRVPADLDRSGLKPLLNAAVKAWRARTAETPSAR